MKKIFDGFKRIQENISAFLLAVMVIDIFVATFCRYTTIVAVPWAEEVARYSMIWLIFIAAGAAAAEGAHFGVDIVIANLPRKGKMVCYVIQSVIVPVFCGFAAYYGVANVITQKINHQLSPSMQIPIWIMYTSVIFALVTFGIQTIYYNVNLLRGLKAEGAGEAGIVENEEGGAE